MSRIVLTGGPGTGKTSVINELENKGYQVFHEAASRLIQEGFITPVMSGKPGGTFSLKVYHQRKTNYFTGIGENKFFYDRGLPDILGFSRYLDNEPEADVMDDIRNLRYDQVFIFPPWRHMYKQTAGRMESFEVSEAIGKQIELAYQSVGYKLIRMPRVSVEERIDFILGHLNQ